MKKIIFLLSTILCGELLAQQNPRDFVTDEFRGRLTFFTYSESEGNTVTVPYITKFGRLKRDFRAFNIVESSEAPGSSFDDIPSAPLAAEHWYFSFEMLMKVQREYAACVGALNENLIRLGVTCLVDQPCNSLYNDVMVTREYWVPFNIVENFSGGNPNQPPRREDFIAHFKGGIESIRIAISHRDSCEFALFQLRQIR